MSLPTLNIENQFGEVSQGVVLSGSANLAAPIATKTILSNLTTGSAAPSGNTLADVSQILPAKTGITAISALASPVTAITVTTAGGVTYSDAAINTALASVVTDLQTQLTAINAMLAALKAIV